MTTLREVAAFECEVSGHDWQTVRYVDALDTRTGAVTMAAWVELRCWRCRATDRIANPEAGRNVR